MIARPRRRLAIALAATALGVLVAPHPAAADVPTAWTDSYETFTPIP
jgi:hypothetical protein